MSDAGAVIAGEDNVQLGKQRSIRRRKGGYASALTCKRAELRDLIATASADQVEIKLGEIERCLDNFWSCHAELRDLLVESDDQSEVARLDSSSKETDLLTWEIIRQAKDWLKEVGCLQVPLDTVHDSVKPRDSISQTGKESLHSSATSSVSSARVKAAAKKAALMAQVRVLEQQQAIKLKQTQMQHEQGRLDLEAQVAEVLAEERVYQ